MTSDQNVQFSKSSNMPKYQGVQSHFCWNWLWYKKWLLTRMCRFFHLSHKKRDVSYQTSLVFCVVDGLESNLFSYMTNFITINHFFPKIQNYFCSFWLWYKKWLLTRMCSFLNHLTCQNIKGSNLISAETGYGIKKWLLTRMCRFFQLSHKKRDVGYQTSLLFFVVDGPESNLFSSMTKFITINHFLSKIQNYFCSFWLWYKKWLLTRMCSFLNYLTCKNIKESNLISVVTGLVKKGHFARMCKL